MVMRAAAFVLLLAAPSLADGLQMRPALRGLERRPQPIARTAVYAVATGEAQADGAQVTITWTERINRVSTFASILCVSPAGFILARPLCTHIGVSDSKFDVR